MLTLTLARHGQTVENKEGILQGQSPGHLNATGITQAETLRDRLRPEDYDLILTGDLGHVGHAIVADLFSRDGVRLGERYDDCGRRVFDRERQDVHAGGSGAGCSAIVLAGDILKRLRAGELRRVLLAATGALMSPVSAMQGESIPAVCHAVTIEGEGIA